MNILKELLRFSNAFQICQILVKNGAESRFVGGCVRDIIIGYKPTDIDIATNLPPDKTEEILLLNGIEFYSTGKEFGTITAILNKEKIDITSLRKDVSCDGRYAAVKYTNNWQEDAARRDFTINALSADLDGNVYDYWNGINDLKSRVVKFIGDPEKRIKEDYLRILRFFRFSSFFAESVNQEGLDASKRYFDKLGLLSGFRIKAEFEKLFSSPKAIESIKLMHEVGLLKSIFSINTLAIQQLKKMSGLAKKLNIKIISLHYWAAILSNYSETQIPFSKDEKKMLDKFYRSKDFYLKNSDYQKLWRIYKSDFKNIIIFHLSLDDNQPNIKILRELIEKEIKPLPISGRDLVALNIKPGKNIRMMLENAEQIWYDSDFQISKQDLLRKILNYEI